jgi:hypothetical protein
VNPNRSVVTEEMEHLLKIWLDDQAQRRIPVSQVIISAKSKSLHYELRMHMGNSVKMSHYFLQAMVGLIGLTEGQVFTILNVQVRLQVQILMLSQHFLQNWLN